MAYTTMDVLALSIRELILEPLTGSETDGFRFKNTQIVRAFNRAIKHAVGTRKGVKVITNVPTVAGVNASALPAGVLEVYGANYQGQPLSPLSTWEKDVALVNARTFGAIQGYSIDGEPPYQITLLDAPTANGTTDLKVNALVFPANVADLTAQSSSPLPPYYDDFLIFTTAGMLLTPDEGTAQDLKYAKYADEELRIIQGIEEPRNKDPQGDRFHSISEYCTGEMD